MPTPEQLAVQLARAFALTEIFPVRHSNVQEALEAFVDAASEDALSVEVDGEALTAGGAPVELSR